MDCLVPYRSKWTLWIMPGKLMGTSANPGALEWYTPGDPTPSKARPPSEGRYPTSCSFQMVSRTSLCRAHCSNLALRLWRLRWWWSHLNMKASVATFWMELVKSTPRYWCHLKIQLQQSIQKQPMTTSLSDKGRLSPSMIGVQIPLV